MFKHKAPPDFRAEMRESYRYEKLEHRLFHYLDAGHYQLSVQASREHYCYPRKLFDTPYSYEEFELAIFDPADAWAIPALDPQLSQFEWAGLFEGPYLDYVPTTSVAASIPTETVQEIFENLHHPFKWHPAVAVAVFVAMTVVASLI